MTLKYDEHGHPYEDVTEENKKLNNRIKEERQYDNLVHQQELERTLKK